MPLQDTLLRRPLVRWSLLVGFWILIGFVFVGYSYLIHINAGLPFAWNKVLWIVVGWSLWIPLTPLVIGLARRFPIERPRWGRRLAGHFGLASLIIVAEVVVFVSIRATVVAWVGSAAIGATMMETSFSFGEAFRDSLLRSFFFDLLIYMMIVAVVHALDYYRCYRERDLRGRSWRRPSGCNSTRTFVQHAARHFVNDGRKRVRRLPTLLARSPR